MSNVYKQQLANLKPTLADWGWNDRVTELYRSVFNASNIAHHSSKEEDILGDLRWRNDHKLPPGYKDAAKPDEGIGDVIIWNTLLDLAKQQKKDVIFVSNEEKADWRLRSGTETLMARPELRHEFYQRTGCHFYIMNWATFLEVVNATATTVAEAKRVQVVSQHSLEQIEKEIDAVLRKAEDIGRQYAELWAGPIEEKLGRERPYIEESIDILIDSLVQYRHIYENLGSHASNLTILDKQIGLLEEISKVSGHIKYIDVRQKHSPQEEIQSLLRLISEFSSTYSLWFMITL